MTYTGVLLKSLGTTFASYFIGSKVLANFAYRGIYDGIGYFVVLLTMLFTFVTDFGMTEKIYDAQIKKKNIHDENMECSINIWNSMSGLDGIISGFYTGRINGN